jgi:hypothetical protein
MARTRRDVLLVALLACLPAAMLGGALAVTGHLTAGGHASRIDEVWVPNPLRIAITGDVRRVLAPGLSAPIRLTFRNDNAESIRMRRVKVKIVAVSAPHADARHPCSRADFSVRQMPKLTLRVRPGSSDLVSMRVPTTSWPALTMLNRPVNQDGCKGALLTLGYRSHRAQR